MENSNTAEKKYLSPLHKAAVWYATMGLQVIPLNPKSKLSPVKWGSQATDDIDVINQWWQQNPNYNIGIVTGEKSGLVVIDFDTEEAWMKGQELGLPKAPVAKTGRGYHVYCKYKDGVRNFQNRSDMPGIDLRGQGGYVVAAPSVHENGEVYSWVEGKHFDDHAYGELPEWVYIKNPAEKVPVEELLEGVDDGQRNNALTRIQGSLIGKGFTYDEAVTNAHIWNQNNTEPLEEKEVVKTVESIFKREHGSIPELVDKWESPILFKDIETPEISADILPGWLGDYARAVSKFNQTPEAMAVMIGLSVVSSCVLKRFEVSPYGDDYREILALWTLTILPPSERKSPVMNNMKEPIVEWESTQKDRLARSIIETQTRRAVDQKRIEKLRQAASNTEDAAERNKLIEDMVSIENDMPEEVRLPKIWTSDATTESFQDNLAGQGERLSVIADEGGIFEVMAGLYNDGKVNIDVYLNGYSGSSIRIDRKNRPTVDLRRPAITFGLAVQPMVMEEFASKRKKAFRGKGALARFLYCLPQTKVGTRDIGTRVSIPADVKRRYAEGINSLLGIEKIVDNNNVEVPRILTLDNDALKSWELFSKTVEGMLAPDKMLSQLNDWGGKLAGNCLRIAGLMHLVENGPNNLIIERHTVEKSIKLCNLLIQHAVAAFGCLGTDETLNGAKKIFKWIGANNYQGFSRNDCHRSLHGTFDLSEQLDKPLKALEDRHIIKRTRIVTTGRDKEYYQVNPYFTCQK